MYEQSAMRSHSSADSSKDGEDTRVTPGSEDYYPRVAVAALIKVRAFCCCCAALYILQYFSTTVYHSTPPTHDVVALFSLHYI